MCQSHQHPSSTSQWVGITNKSKGTWKIDTKITTHEMIQMFNELVENSFIYHENRN